MEDEQTGPTTLRVRDRDGVAHLVVIYSDVEHLDADTFKAMQKEAWKEIQEWRGRRKRWEPYSDDLYHEALATKNLLGLSNMNIADRLMEKYPEAFEGTGRHAQKIADILQVMKKREAYKSEHPGEDMPRDLRTGPMSEHSDTELRITTRARIMHEKPGAEYVLFSGRLVTEETPETLERPLFG